MVGARLVFVRREDRQALAEHDLAEPFQRVELPANKRVKVRVHIYGDHEDADTRLLSQPRLTRCDKRTSEVGLDAETFQVLDGNRREVSEPGFRVGE